MKNGTGLVAAAAVVLMVPLLVVIMVLGAGGKPRIWGSAARLALL